MSFTYTIKCPVCKKQLVSSTYEKELDPLAAACFLAQARSEHAQLSVKCVGAKGWNQWVIDPPTITDEVKDGEAKE